MSRKRCCYCGKLTEKWQRIAGVNECYDGCYSTTGKDDRTVDGTPLWLGGVEKYKKTETVIDNTEKTLKSCPFCGKHEATVVEDYENSFIVCCNFCNATSRRMWSSDAAIEQWNKREG